MDTTQFRALLEELRITQNDLSKMAGISVSQVSRILNGHSPVPEYMVTILTLTRDVRELRGALKAFSKNLMAAQ
jgi:transcriptional regulator with XRE-family HTH domain